MAIAHHAPNEQHPTLQKAGQGWHFGYLGESAWIRDGLGMRCINILFHKPGEYLDVVKLYRDAYGPDSSSGMEPYRKMSAQQLANEGFYPDNDQPEDPVMDEDYMEECKQKIRELKAELEAEAPNSPHVPALRAQIEELEDFLLANVDHRGRPRQSPGLRRRAQVNVRKAIMRVINLLSTIYPALGAYLKLTIVTGYSCCFDPNRIPPAAGKP